MSWTLGSLNPRSDRPKFMQITERVIEAIHSKSLGLGDNLPSVNEAIEGFGVSRDTVVKAYNELKRRGIIEATPNRACFVSSIFINFKKKVLFLTDSINGYKERVYGGLISGLDEEYGVDIIPHNDDFDLLKFAYNKSKNLGLHECCLIIPTVAMLYETEFFSFIQAKNILFIDRGIPGLPFPCISQDLSHGFYKALHPYRERFAVYKEIVFLTRRFTNPVVEEMKANLKHIADECRLPFSVETTMFTEREVDETLWPRAGVCYITLHPQHTIHLIRVSSKLNLSPGHDFGIIALNDEPMYEILAGGVTTLSADFYEMGQRAARFVRAGDLNSSVVDTKLILRKTFG